VCRVHVTFLIWCDVISLVLGAASRQVLLSNGISAWVWRSIGFLSSANAYANLYERDSHFAEVYVLPLNGVKGDQQHQNAIYVFEVHVTKVYALISIDDFL
jgi:hypothetical protein